MKSTEMSTDKYSHKLLLLIHAMINLLAARGCNGKRKEILFPDTALFLSFFSHGAVQLTRNIPEHINTTTVLIFSSNSLL